MVKDAGGQNAGHARAAASPVSAQASTPVPEARSTSVTEAPDRTGLVKLLRKRLRRFLALVSEVLAGESPDAVHDLRVWSRRLQQTLTALFPESRSRKLRSLRRTLRRARRALGGWRNCDVVLQRLVRKERQARRPDKRRAWTLVIDFVRNTRERELRRARKRLLKLGLFSLAKEMEALIEAPGSNGQVVSASLPEVVSVAGSQWQAALSRALEDRRVENIHGFRIQTKRLRYRLELLHDLGALDTSAAVEWLKSLQDGLGTWHDRRELGRAIAETLTKPEALQDEPRTAIMLLKELEKEQALAVAELEELMREASDSPRRAQFDACMAVWCHAPRQQTDEPSGPLSK